MFMFYDVEQIWCFNGAGTSCWFGWRYPWRATTMFLKMMTGLLGWLMCRVLFRLPEQAHSHYHPRPATEIDLI